MIVTYAGHPLYTCAGDAAPGDTKGEGLDPSGAKWSVLARDTIDAPEASKLLDT
jgi:predicted lipoprotein with Yx(FWY)xxD motif